MCTTIVTQNALTDEVSYIFANRVRGGRCVHRHFSVTQLGLLFCDRVRQQRDTAQPGTADLRTIERVRRAVQDRDP